MVERVLGYRSDIIHPTRSLALLNRNCYIIKALILVGDLQGQHLSLFSTLTSQLLAFLTPMDTKGKRNYNSCFDERVGKVTLTFSQTA